MEQADGFKEEGTDEAAADIPRKVINFKITLKHDDMDKAKEIANAIMINTIVEDSVMPNEIYDMEWEIDGEKGPSLVD